MTGTVTVKGKKDIFLSGQHNQKLLAEDPAYAANAERWDRKIKDVHEWLTSIPFQPPSLSDGPPVTVTYHESCHLAHGQKVTSQPREILRSIPHLTLVELPESTWCCGSAGIYNLIQPEMADSLLERTIRHIEATRHRGRQQQPRLPPPAGKRNETPPSARARCPFHHTPGRSLPRRGWHVGTGMTGRIRPL